MMTQVSARPGAGVDVFFNTKSIAIVGASDDITKIGGRPVHLLKKYGYKGHIYPVNPKTAEVQGLTAYASVSAIPGSPEMALLAVPAAATPAALRECAAKGVRGVVVLSSGFAEAGEEGARLQAELVKIARAHSMRLLGPNCLGSISVPNATIISFSIVLEEYMPASGSVGIVSQSGNIGSYAMQNIAQRGLGVSRFIATGNEADVDVADGIAALANDPQTCVILCCMETCRDSARLIAALETARAQGKPVIALKIGATEQGQAAAASHTGALAGSDAVIDAVFRRYGVVRVRSLEALLEVGHAASLLTDGRLPKNDAVTLVAASGGFGIMMADAMADAGLKLLPLAQTTCDRIHAVLPGAGTNNPVDTSAQISSRPEILQGVLSALLEDDNNATTVLFLSLSLYNQRMRGVYLDALSKMRTDHPERLLVIISRGPADAVAEITALGIPVFSSIDSAASAIPALVNMGRLAQLPRAERYEGPTIAVDPLVFRNEFHAKRALGAAGISVPHEEVVNSAEAAVKAAELVGYPVVLKIASEDIAHKTEVGGVALGLADQVAVIEAYARIQSNVARNAPNAHIDGMLVAPMLRGGTELIAGISSDPVFGPVVMVGMGGIYAEVLKDVAVQVAPVSESEAEAMIRGLRMFPLLDGARGQEKADVAAAAKTVSKLSHFACAHAGDVAEIDLNPILVRPQGQGVTVLDALMIPVSSAAAAH